MVKNSKYIFTLIGLIISLSSFSQSFSAIKRDMEITRVTLENFLKKWDGEPLLNRIMSTEATHEKGQGITFKIEAPNAGIYMNTQGGVFRNGDNQMMDTFYTSDIIGLQQDRLTEAIKKFILDFYSYMPQLESRENFKVVFEVKDSEIKRNGKVLPPSPKANTRTYELVVKWEMQDLADLKSGKLEANQFSNKISIEKE